MKIEIFLFHRVFLRAYIFTKVKVSVPPLPPLICISSIFESLRVTISQSSVKSSLKFAGEAKKILKSKSLLLLQSSLLLLLSVTDHVPETVLLTLLTVNVPFELKVKLYPVK